MKSLPWSCSISDDMDFRNPIRKYLFDFIGLFCPPGYNYCIEIREYFVRSLMGENYGTVLDFCDFGKADRFDPCALQDTSQIERCDESLFAAKRGRRLRNIDLSAPQPAGRRCSIGCAFGGGIGGRCRKDNAVFQRHITD